MFSSNTFNNLLIDHVHRLAPNTILDVGAGGGKNGRMIRQVYNCQIDAIEPTEEYIKENDLKSIYNNVYQTDIDGYIRNYSQNNYDLVIFSDVLEHLYKNEVINYLDYFLYRSKWIVIIWPTNLLQNSDVRNNYYEIHKSNFYIKDLSDFEIVYYLKNFGHYNYYSPEYPASDFHYVVLKGNLSKRNEFIYNFSNWD